MDLEKEPINLEQSETTSENQDNVVDEQEFNTENEASTIFTKNTSWEEPKKVVSGKTKRLRLIITLATIAVVITGSLLALHFLVPEDETQNSDNTSHNIKVKSVLADDISKIEIESNLSNMVLTSVLVDDEDSTSSDSKTAEWSLKGYDKNLIASSSLSSAADSLATFYATREMPDKTLDYGFDKPNLTAKITLRDGGGYTVTVGRMSPDGSGYYLKVSDADKIYLVPAGSVENYYTTPEKMADQVIVDTPVLDSDTKTSDKKYFDDEGAISTFDSISVSGSKYGKSVKLLPLADNEMAKYVVDLGSYQRFADTDAVEEMFGIVTNGLVAIDTYKLNPTSADIKKYGLDKPEVELAVKCGSYEVSLIAKMYDEENEYYAVMVDGLDGIYAVTEAALSMLKLGVTDFYNEFVFLEYLRDFSNIKVKTPEKTYNFDVTYDEKEEEISATESGKTVDSDLFTAYYSHITTIRPEVQESYISGSTDLTIDFTYKDASKGTRKLEFVKQSDRRYLVKLDGFEMGLVNSTTYDHLVVYAQYVLDKKGIPEP